MNNSNTQQNNVNIIFYSRRCKDSGTLLKILKHENLLGYFDSLLDIR